MNVCVFLLERSKEEAALCLYRAAVDGDLVAMAAALAQGSEVNSVVLEEQGRTALIGAAVGVSLFLSELKLNIRSLSGSQLESVTTCRGRSHIDQTLNCGVTKQPEGASATRPLWVMLESMCVIGYFSKGGRSNVFTFVIGSLLCQSTYGTFPVLL